MLKIRSKREKANITQKRLAEMLGVKAHTVSQWETNKRHPDIDRLPDIAAALGCTIDELYGNDFA